MARTLAKNVYVGETLYMAGETPPKEDADQITNPAAWGEVVEDAPAAPAPTPAAADNGSGAAPTPVKKAAAKKPAAKKTAAKKS